MVTREWQGGTGACDEYTHTITYKIESQQGPIV